MRNTGLFLGDDATNALNNQTGRFWVTQDQRHTLRSRFQYRVRPRWWPAAGVSYGSGLPTEFNGTAQDAIAQFGQQIVGRVDLEHGRVRPSLSLDASSGVELYRTDKLTMRLQADVENLTNRLNVIDFTGLFSGTALAPPRTSFLRFETRF